MYHFSEPIGEALVRGIWKGLCSFQRRETALKMYHFSEPIGEALVRGIWKGLCSFQRRETI